MLYEALTLREVEAGCSLLPRLITGDVDGDHSNGDLPSDQYHITSAALEWVAFVCNRLAKALRRQNEDK